MSRGTLTDGQRESVVIIEQRGRELLYLIDTILDAARVEAGELTVSPEWTRVGDVVMPAVLDARELTAGMDVDITGEIQPGVPRILVDATRLTQALTAIILVASRFAEKGHVVVRAAMPAEGRAAAHRRRGHGPRHLGGGPREDLRRVQARRPRAPARQPRPRARRWRGRSSSCTAAASTWRRRRRAARSSTCGCPASAGRPGSEGARSHRLDTPTIIRATLHGMPPTTFPLDGSEWAMLREQVATIQALVTRKYGAEPFDQSLDDLAPLQRLLDERVWDDTAGGLISAPSASAFGNVVAKVLAFEWVAETDGRGARQPALLLKATKALVVQPQKLILDRVRRGDPVDLRQLMDDIKAQVAKTKLLPKIT